MNKPDIDKLDQAIRSVKLIIKDIERFDLTEDYSTLSIALMKTRYNTLVESYKNIYDSINNVWDKIEDSDKNTILAYHERITDMDIDLRAAYKNTMDGKKTVDKITVTTLKLVDVLVQLTPIIVAAGGTL